MPTSRSAERVQTLRLRRVGKQPNSSRIYVESSAYLRRVSNAPPGSYNRRTFSRDSFQETGMGKGDTRTRKGKIYNGSYGKKRPGRVKKKTEAASAPAKTGRK
jgi:30S ribosomal protein S31